MVTDFDGGEFVKNKKVLTKGSVTVEAAITLPIFIIAFIVFVFIIKVYYVNEIVQHAITGACSEMSAYSLLYYETNADEVISALEKVCNSNKVSESLGDNSFRSYIRTLGKDAADYIRAQSVLIPLTKLLVKRNLEVSYNNDVNARLKSLHLKDGFESLDFSDSRMLADGKSIDIAVSYNISFPFASNLFSGVKITQTASACVWAGEEGINNKDDETGIWNLGNISRGRKIRELQGANLPYFFPAIAIFQNGTATSIKSLNVDKAYYQDSSNLKKKLLLYIDKLEAFEGGKCSGITVESSTIYKKELRLIIPETDLHANQQQTIDECILIARSKGIYMNVIKAYGKGGTGQTGESEQDD